MFRRILGVFISLFTISVSAQDLHFKDSIVAVASTRYQDAGLINNLLFGTNYRRIWARPVKIAVFDLKKSGFRIKQLGGGQQTNSLRLEDPKGREWVLRSVDKYAERLNIPVFLPAPMVRPFAQQMISGAFPYAALMVYPLARVTGVISAEPGLYWLEDNAALGQYQGKIRSGMYILEQREPTPDESDTKSTRKVLEEVFEENENLVMQKALLKVRLLDMLVADWDRHADQWRWDEVEWGNMRAFYAIPRDRDQAFFNSNGLLVKLSTIVAAPQFRGFDRKLHVKDINWKSWTFDRTFLNELDENDWRSIISEFRQSLTDQAIRNAVEAMPAEIRPLVAEKFISRLKERRDQLEKEGLKYYRYISRVVVINGTDEDEIFHFKSTNGTLAIEVRDRKEGRLVYGRRFLFPDTWKIIVNGLGGNDSFNMDESVSSRIRMEVHGGEGKNDFRMKGGVRTLVYGNQADEYQLGGKIRKK